jgi:hypothetical protein
MARPSGVIMSNVIFKASPGPAVEVTAWLGDEAKGWFFLERLTANSYVEVARSVKAPDADESITHQFSAAELAGQQWPNLKLRLRVNALIQSGEKAPLFLRVTQGGVALDAEDFLGAPVNDKTKGKRVEFPKVASNVPSLHDFIIRF